MMININNLDFSFRKQFLLFNQLNLNIDKGSITGLLGKNGAGKTTLLKLICGLLKPGKGTISTKGFCPGQRHVEMLQQIFFVPEEFHLPDVSIRDYVKAQGIFYPTFDDEMMTKILSEFHLKSWQYLKHLSYGQKKKFLIAFALSTRCSILVLDEPTNGLDIPSKSLFRKIMAGSLSDDQLVIISTHQVKDVENLLDQLIVLEDGKVVFQQTLHNISKDYYFGAAGSLQGIDALYTENAPGGYRFISAARNGNSSQVDLELLFNAIISGNLNSKNHAVTTTI